MEVLKEVFIKECGNVLHDKVFFVENLPKKFLYEKTIRMVQRYDRDGYTDGTLVADPEGEMQDTLLPGLEFSQTGDNGILFWRENQEATKLLKDIDRYISGTLPRDVRLESRVPNTQEYGNASANPLPMSQIPRIALPLPVDAEIVPFPSLPKIKVPSKKLILPTNMDNDNEVFDEPKKKGWSNEVRQAARERMKKMHEDRKKKKAVLA